MKGKRMKTLNLILQQLSSLFSFVVVFSFLFPKKKKKSPPFFFSCILPYLHKHENSAALCDGPYSTAISKTTTVVFQHHLTLYPARYSCSTGCGLRSFPLSFRTTSSSTFWESFFLNWITVPGVFWSKESSFSFFPGSFWPSLGVEGADIRTTASSSSVSELELELVADDESLDCWLRLGRMLARSFLCDVESDSVSEVSESDLLPFFLCDGGWVSDFSKAAKWKVWKIMVLLFVRQHKEKLFNHINTGLIFLLLLLLLFLPIKGQKHLVNLEPKTWRENFPYFNSYYLVTHGTTAIKKKEKKVT